MTITVGASTPTGTYPITVTGSGGGIQQNAVVTVTVTPVGAGSGNGIIVYSTSGSAQTNRVVSIGRFFKQGDIPHFAEAVVAGSGILTQCDVKNRWLDGSLKFAIVSFIVPNVATGGTQVTFQDQSTGNNTGYLAQSDMLNASYDFDGVIQLTGARSPSISARSVLQAGNFRYWLQGPIVTAVILEDRDNRTFDVNTDGGSGNPLHPIYEAWFYPQNNAVEVGFTLENAWASHTASLSARDQTFSLTLSTGNSSRVTQLTQGSFVQYGFTRWRRAYWINPPVGGCTDKLCGMSIDYGWTYLSQTGAYPNFDPQYATSGALTSMYSTYTTLTTGANAGRLTIPGIDSPSSNGGIVDYDENPNGVGYHDWIGLFNKWDVLLLETGDSRMLQMSLDNADLSGRWPIFFREADNSAGTGGHYDCTSVSGGSCDGGTIETQGLNVSINARQQVQLNTSNWGTCNASDGIAYTLPTDGSNWSNYPADTSHIPDLAYVPYSLTGKYYYLEHEIFEAGFAAGYGQGCYAPTSGVGRQGHYGLQTRSTREQAWALRTMAYAAFIAVDGQPQAAYFTSILQKNLAMMEGEHGMSLDVTASDVSYPYSWGQSLWIFSQASNTSQDPMQLYRFSDCLDGTTTCYANSTCASGGIVDPTKVQSAESSFMSGFMDQALGLIKQLGIIDPTALLTRNAHRYLNIVLNPAANKYLIGEYVYPILKVGGSGCNSYPINGTCQWVADWTTFKNAYCSQPSDWLRSGSDYEAISAAAMSFLTGITVDGYSGAAAYNYLVANDDAVPAVFATEPMWAIRPLK
jgi:hypothetical protein